MTLVLEGSQLRSWTCLVVAFQLFRHDRIESLQTLWRRERWHDVGHRFRLTVMRRVGHMWMNVHNIRPGFHRSPIDDITILIWRFFVKLYFSWLDPGCEMTLNKYSDLHGSFLFPAPSVRMSLGFERSPCMWTVRYEQSLRPYRGNRWMEVKQWQLNSTVMYFWKRVVKISFFFLAYLILIICRCRM